MVRNMGFDIPAPLVDKSTLAFAASLFRNLVLAVMKIRQYKSNMMTKGT